ncbi:MAG TPA: hypothetical protein VK177_21210 [Flavobacteriales bacterium]|nr:hypothetical protein [Flavobacteriales bacterium]
MSQNKNILIIGMDPYTVDFSQPGFMPGLTAEKVMAQTEAEQKRLLDLGYNAGMALIDAKTNDLAQLTDLLKSKEFDAVMIGAGIRVPQINFMLFERLINCVHEQAPHSKITFNTSPADTLEAFKRWV